MTRNLLEDTRRLLRQLERSRISATAYDTAWIATLRVDDGSGRQVPRFPAALQWLSTHQSPDGSWGSPWPYFHDRLLSTLRAVLTLHELGRREDDRQHIDRGIRFIWRNAGRLREDPWETVGFELIFPTLLAEARAQGLPLPYNAFAEVEVQRAEKLAKAPLDLAYSADSPMSVNLEALGPSFDPTRAVATQDTLGGVGMSPSATAFLLRHWPDNARALAYLDLVLQADAETAAGPYYPLETFERSWTLFLLQHGRPSLYQDLPELTQPLLDFLRSTMTAQGWTATHHAPNKESDTTSVCFVVLSQTGYQLDPQLLYRFEEADHFRVYPYERNPSISANAHVLSALQWCPPEEAAPRIRKVIDFLARTRAPAGYWLDKWHVSPYYATTQVMLAALRCAPELVQPAIQWLLYTRDASGTWGYYAPTAEETAYAVLALRSARDAGYEVPLEILRPAVAYLQTHVGPALLDCPALWIHKTLYAPVQIVQAAILAALLSCADLAGAP